MKYYTVSVTGLGSTWTAVGICFYPNCKWGPYRTNYRSEKEAYDRMESFMEDLIKGTGYRH